MMERFPSQPILVVDDEEAWQRNIRVTLQRGAGIDHVLTCGDSRQVEPMIRDHSPSLVVMDVTMPDVDGIELLARIVEQWPELPVIMLTGRTDAEVAVKCMKTGAYDYFVKSDEHERVVAAVRHILNTQSLQRENERLHAALRGDGPVNPEPFQALLTRSPLMLNIFRYIEAISTGREPVLIVGETGSGKELLVRALHAVSCRDQPLVAVNTAGLDNQVFSDTLFGHVRGAFTGADKDRPGMIEAAGKGVLFLDEIGDLSSQLQVKLLRLLQEREYMPLGTDTPRHMHARVVVATHRDLEGRVKEGRFRQDLYYRLSTHRIMVPPLRERPEDLPLLIEHFVQEAARELQRPSPKVPDELVTLLHHYAFPGNVRELRALMFEAVSRHRRGMLSLSGFRNLLTLKDTPTDVQEDDELRFPRRLPTLKEVGELLVSEALRRAGGNQATAAAMLGISRPALTQRLSKKRRLT